MCFGAFNGEWHLPFPTPGQHRRMALFLFLLNLRPGVAQGHRAVEDWFSRSRVGIDAEVTLPLKLEPLARFCRGKTRFKLAAGKDRKRVLVQVVQPIPPFLDL